MFTIKHVDSYFNEFAIEAESYSVELGSGNAGGPGIPKFRFLTYDTKWRDNNYTGMWAGDPCDYKTPDTDTIYVMNRNGATVAVYHFYAPRSAENPTQDEPHLAAAQMQAA